MAIHLGLSDAFTTRLNLSEHGRNQLRITWSSVVELDLLAATCEFLSHQISIQSINSYSILLL